MASFYLKMCFQETAYQENKNIQGKNEQEKQQQTVFFFLKSYYKKYFLTDMQVNIICFHTLQQKGELHRKENYCCCV